jgi:hypothetical protein
VTSTSRDGFSATWTLSAGTGCYDCGAGKYSVAGTSVCLNCEAGSYGPTAGLNQCQMCFPGKYSHVYATICTSCPVGTYGPNFGALLVDCLPCGPGTFAAAFGMSSCISCSAGKYGTDVGSTSSSSCLNCPKGTYSSFDGPAHFQLVGAGYCRGPGSNDVQVNGRKATEVISEFDCAAECLSLHGCIGYAYGSPTSCYNYGASLDQGDMPDGWVAWTRPNTEIERSSGSSDAVCKKLTGSLPPPSILSSSAPGNCAICPNSTFQNTAGSSHCEICLPGTYTSRQLTLNISTASQDYEFDMKPAQFGASLAAFKTWNGVLVEFLPLDACNSSLSPLQSQDLESAIVLIKRGGGCEFGYKAWAAENKKAAAVIIYNDIGGPAMDMPPGNFGENVSIPVVAISRTTAQIVMRLMQESSTAVNAELPARGSLDTVCLDCTAGTYSSAYGAQDCTGCPR